MGKYEYWHFDSYGEHAKIFWYYKEV